MKKLLITVLCGLCLVSCSRSTKALKLIKESVREEYADMGSYEVVQQGPLEVAFSDVWSTDSMQVLLYNYDEFYKEYKANKNYISKLEKQIPQLKRQAASYSDLAYNSACNVLSSTNNFFSMYSNYSRMSDYNDKSDRATSEYKKAIKAKKEAEARVQVLAEQLDDVLDQMVTQYSTFTPKKVGYTMFVKYKVRDNNGVYGMHTVDAFYNKSMKKLIEVRDTSLRSRYIGLESFVKRTLQSKEE